MAYQIAGMLYWHELDIENFIGISLQLQNDDFLENQGLL